MFFFSNSRNQIFRRSYFFARKKYFFFYLILGNTAYSNLLIVWNISIVSNRRFIPCSCDLNIVVYTFTLVWCRLGTCWSLRIQIRLLKKLHITFMYPLIISLMLPYSRDKIRYCCFPAVTIKYKSPLLTFPSSCPDTIEKLSWSVGELLAIFLLWTRKVFLILLRCCCINRRKYLVTSLPSGISFAQ